MSESEIREDLLAVSERLDERIAAASDLEELSVLEGETIGRRSKLAEARRSLGSLDPDARRELGALINDVAERAEELLAARRRALEQEHDAALLARQRVDTTLPGRVPPRGTHHLINQVMDEIVDIFVSIGYTVATGPEIETDWYNFTALNIPPGHPARLMWDTLYVDHGDDSEDVMLRTHTSPMQIRYMEQHDPPVYIVVPGRTFRRDETDATHTPVFHQLEGLAVAEGITFTDLKGTLAYLARQFFGPHKEVRFHPDYFPFTEPSAGMQVKLESGWLELLGCGMVHPAVFEAVGYDPSRVTGFAFGFGIDRFAMVRRGLTDLRDFWEGDVRVLRQFR